MGYIGQWAKCKEHRGQDEMGVGKNVKGRNVRKKGKDSEQWNIHNWI
jgi:hypothetical protein